MAIRFFGIVILVVLSAAGCRDKGYSQATPDDVLTTARLMVENGDARRLTRLVYADSPQMRELLDHFGQTLESLAALGVEVNRAFPREVADLRAQAEEAARRGEATSFVGRIVGMSGRSVRVGAAQGSGPDPRDAFNQAAKELMADPYAWLTRNAERLSTTRMTDDTAAVLWDGKPVFGVGLVMKEEKGRWYVVLPTAVPPVSQIMPRNEPEWEIAHALVQILDNALTDTADDIRKGKAGNLEDVARVLGEKAFITTMMGMIAYGKAMEERRKTGGG